MVSKPLLPNNYKPKNNEEVVEKRLNRNLVRELGLTINMNPKKFISRNIESGDSPPIQRRHSSINDEFSLSTPFFKRRKTEKEKKRTVLNMLTN